MNRITARVLFLFSVSAIMINLLSVEARAEIKIGVLQWSEETFYEESKNGILYQLEKDGFGKPAVKYSIENARGGKARAVQVAQQFAAAKMDLIITVGTSATMALAREIKDVPIVFSTVYDPVETGIAKDWKSSGNNTTGTSTYIPMSKLLNHLKEFTPVKRLAVLYTPYEKNSEAELKDLQRLQTDFQIKVIPVPLTRKEEVAPILQEVVRTADAIYLSGSSIADETIPTIVDMASKKKVATITHLDSLVNKGVLLGVCADAYQVGRLAGKKAVKILRGAKPASIPIEPLEKLDVIINMRTAKAGQFQIPPLFMKSVTKVIE